MGSPAGSQPPYPVLPAEVLLGQTRFRCQLLSLSGCSLALVCTSLALCATAKSEASTRSFQAAAAAQEARFVHWLLHKETLDMQDRPCRTWPHAIGAVTDSSMTHWHPAYALCNRWHMMQPPACSSSLVPTLTLYSTEAANTPPQCCTGQRHQRFALLHIIHACTRTCSGICLGILLVRTGSSGAGALYPK